MAQARPLYIGPRLRRLRRELGLTQQAMGEDLAISPSYIALLERNQRPITAELLLRLARTYKLDVAELAQDDGPDIARRIGEALRDPLFAGIDLPPLSTAPPQPTALSLETPHVAPPPHGAPYRTQDPAGMRGRPVGEHQLKELDQPAWERRQVPAGLRPNLPETPQPSATPTGRPGRHFTLDDPAPARADRPHREADRRPTFLRRPLD